jgi:hypothetical protein
MIPKSEVHNIEENQVAKIWQDIRDNLQQILQLNPTPDKLEEILKGLQSIKIFHNLY